ncbi:hypothetical protein CLIB1423_05S02168 [[Candida] railenensis]|uniref:Uncharacterized protein n=1 Tax=[Candida] railenensis TaxID=45579 RepID=A0A9P0VXY4_9ASCO|nr:hypothetical protein CLIB1423_05S02168 [[Candida] railenensis]
MNNSYNSENEHEQDKFRSLSSPIRHSDYSDNVEIINERQKERHNALYHPLSSPIKRQSTHHGTSRSNVINRRNKHDKLKEIRERHIQEKLVSNRERVANKQATIDYSRNLEEQGNDLFDENELIEMEERERQEKIEEEKKLQLELEEFLRAEQEELEGLVASLEL